MFDYSATGILASIRDLTYSGGSTRDWPDDALLRLVNREVGAYLLPMMMAARRNHLATFADQALVLGQAAYWLPAKAAGSKARAVQLVDAAGNPYAPLKEAQLEEVVNWGASLVNGQIQQGLPTRYYWRGNQLVLWPTPANLPAAVALRIHYLNRPSTLVLNSACVAIAGKSGGAGSSTLTFSGTAPTGYQVGAQVDMVQAGPGFDVLASGLITALGAGTMTVGATLPSNLAIGDWVCLSDTAPVVTGAIPEIVVGCLVEDVALKVMSAKNDAESFNTLRALLRDDEARAKQFLNKRNPGDRETVGAGGLFRFRRGGSSWGGL